MRSVLQNVNKPKNIDWTGVALNAVQIRFMHDRFGMNEDLEHEIAMRGTEEL